MSNKNRQAPTRGNARVMFRIAAFVLCTAALLGLALVIGYCRMFTSILSYDDEGYIMISLKGFLSGHALYRDVYSQYGPFFYLFREWIHGALGLPLTHDTNRLLALGEWLTSCLLAGVLVWRFTASSGFSLLAGCLTFLHLETVIKEPGHPQQLCMILVLASLILATVRGDTIGRVLALLGMGILTGALVMTKANAGLFLGLAVVLALVPLPSGSRQKHVLLGLGLVLSLAVPLMVMRSGLAIVSVRAFIAVAAASLGAIIGLTLTHRCPGRISWRSLVLYLLGTAICVLANAAALRLHGTELKELLQGVLIDPLKFASVFIKDNYPFPVPALLAGAFGVAAATFLGGALGARKTGGGGGDIVVKVFRCLFGFGVIIVALIDYIWKGGEPFVTGATVRGNAEVLMAFGAPFLWLLILPDSKVTLETSECKRNRLTLSLASALHILVAYPVFGTQVTFASLLVLLCGLVALHDGIGCILQKPCLPAVRLPLRTEVWLLLPLIVAFSLKASSYAGKYQERLPLGLWGASRIPLSRPAVEGLQEIVRLLQSRCDTFFSIYGFNSLYFWTRMDPPTFYNATSWPWMLNQDQQEAIKKALAASKNPCIVYNPKTQYMSVRLTKDPSSPLGAYIYENFAPLLSVGDYQLCFRK